MIFTAVKNSISYNSTRVKNNDSNVTLLFLILVAAVVVVVATAEAAFVKSKCCHTNGIHRFYRPILVECNSDGMTLKRTNYALLECIQLTSAVNKMSQPIYSTPASYIRCPMFKSLTGHLTSFSGFSPVIHGKCHYTGCGRKKSPIWEANKFKTKEDTANVFLFMGSTQNAVLHQRVLNKTSLKWRP